MGENSLKEHLSDIIIEHIQEKGHLVVAIAQRDLPLKEICKIMKEDTRMKSKSSINTNLLYKLTNCLYIIYLQNYRFHQIGRTL